MVRRRKYYVLVIALLVMGGIRLPMENAISGELRDLGLHREQLDISTRDKIDQTTYAAAIGGMRTLVATVLSLHAHTLFGEQRWDELSQTYGAIVDFAPRTRYYWEAGAWHMSYNAASHYIHDSSISSHRRRAYWRSYVRRGRDFLELSIRNNPEDWSLHASLAHMLRDPNKLPAFEDRDASMLLAAESYGRAAELGSLTPKRMRRFQFYCLARVAGKEEESLQLARSLYADPSHHRPTLKVLLYALECHADPGRDVEKLALEIFGDPKTAYKALKLHWERTREGYPMDGVAEGLARMENLLGVPMLESILAKPPPPPPSLDDWFKNGP